MNKAKAKKFWEKNKGKIVLVGCGVVGAALAATIGYKRGLKMAHINELWFEHDGVPETLGEIITDKDMLDEIIKLAKDVFNKNLSKDTLIYGIGYSLEEL